MLAVGIFTGLACGTLLAVVGLALWGGFRQVPGLSHAMRVIGWLAGTLLLVGALFAWQAAPSLSGPALSRIEGPVPRLILMAALAAPPGTRRHHHSSWGGVMPILPVLVLAGAGLFWSLGPVRTEVGHLPVAPVELAAIICGGLGARALGEALGEIAVSTPHVEGPALSEAEGPSAIAYALLTLLVGGMALVNLWQRGSVWGGTAGEGGLAGAWLAWSAAWLGPRQYPRLRAVLVVVAALSLIATVLK